MATTLERCVPNPKGINVHGVEQIILRKFYERAHHYGAAPRASYEENPLEWAAHLRHHGGPCRLLDVTRSPFVAAFFALDESVRSSAVWAVHTAHLRKRMGRFAEVTGIAASDDDDLVESAFMDLVASQRDLLLVVEGRAQRINERMAAQQGTFLIPFNLTETFEMNLFGTFELVPGTTMDCSAPIEFTPNTRRPKEWSDVSIIKVVLQPELREEALGELERMNIAAASLFPGLDGFCRSLSSRLTRDSRMEFEEHADWYETDLLVPPQ